MTWFFSALPVVLLSVCLLYAVNREPPEPTYDYEQLTFCLIERGFPYDTIAASAGHVRFCVEYDQKVR